MRPGHPKYIRGFKGVRCHFGSRSFAKRSLVGSSRASKLCSVTQSSGRIRRVAYRHRFSVFPISLGRHPPVELASRSASSLCRLLCGIRRLACFTRRCPSRAPSASQFTLPRIVRVAKTSRLCAVVFRPAKPHNHYAVQTATSGRYPVPCRSLVGVSTPKLPSSRPCRSRANPRPSPKPAWHNKSSPFTSGRKQNSRSFWLRSSNPP